MMKLTLISFFLLLSISASAQSDTLNQRDSKGRLHGYWKAYLDSQAFPTDSANAYFYGMDLYENGIAVFSYSDRNALWRIYRFEYGGVLPQKGSPIPIEGTFKWFDDRGRLLNIEIYKDGKPLFWESTQYVQKDTVNITFKETLYFDKLYNNEPGSFYFTEAWSDSVPREYWHRKGKKGWRAYRIE